MGYLRELLVQVTTSLLRNKLRSFLTMAGIAWGVASIVLIVAMVSRLRSLFRSKLDTTCAKTSFR